ncbi:hypothetical protein [Anabaena sp. 4-3]|uniref:hypothetical protein n=1 Tax=Anabaena sp. 4-3 TaxID=1811979 RepID=UPI00082A1BD2|nr:hypothetical protein [Anabaena sp. 4-3]
MSEESPYKNTNINPSVNSPETQKTEADKNQTSLIDTLAETAVNTGKTVVDTAVVVGTATAQTTYNLFGQATKITGQVINKIGQNWLIRRISGFLNLNWLIGASEDVDLAKVEIAVNKLKQKYPQESPQQIAHRIMMEKATKAGGIGLASSILPGVAVALLAVDLAATMKLQTEMLYQIAGVYGLDLQDPARKGELLTIFGLGLGGNRLLKAAGLVWLRNVPFAGAAIAASANATMSYSLGYAACRFYEAKLDESVSVESPETLAKLKAESEQYLETAIAQQAVMDQILVHVILASHPEKTWQQILPELKAANLSETSLSAIAKNIKSPPPLEQLLNQLDPDFAVPLLAQCQRIAQIDKQTTAVEQEIIRAIANKFDIDLNQNQDNSQ